MAIKLPRIPAALLLAATVCGAHAFPDKALTLVVPFGAGTAVDVNARDFAQALTATGKATVVVDNKPGAEGSIGAMAVLNAAADGHTLMFTSSS
ncbi:MAG: tripartite tricarboxylate transporter substrate-binding protein, partial [Anaerolineae bacterium]|nr:tripartite tricarboxylate transporter substrate-binding protein [Anaerolineae bacterium]